MNIYRLSFCFFIVSTFVLNAQNWQSSPSYNGDSRHHPITFSNDRYGFVIAGQNGSGEDLEDVHRYDSQTQSWEQLASFPGGPRGYAYGVSNNTTAYAGFGKFNSSYPTDWWAYDMSNDEWTQLASFPSAGRSHPALILVDDKIYVGLGSNTANLGDWWEYDIPSDSWSQKADFDFGDRHHPFYFGIDGVPYVGFGHGYSINGNINVYNDFYKYDADTDSWIVLNDFPSEGRVAGTQFDYNGKGYVLSGDGDDHGPLDNGELWEYTPQTDSWIQLESHPGNARWAPGCFVINCNVYFSSGYDRENQIYFNDLIQIQLGQECGCTDDEAVNFDPNTSIDDNSCCYVAGCTDPFALNYDSEACFDDGNCIIADLGCTNPLSNNFDSLANTLVANGGPADNFTYGIGGYHFNDDFDMVFNCLEDVTLNSVDVYAETPFIVTLEILDANDNQVYSNNFALNEGLNTLSLEYDLVVGNDYKIGVVGDNFGLYRNNAVESGVFPINVLNYISITANTTSTPQDYFYYFYNWQLSASCDAINGCTDSLACNYLLEATIDDGSCFYPEFGSDCDSTYSCDNEFIEELFSSEESLSICYGDTITFETNSTLDIQWPNGSDSNSYSYTVLTDTTIVVLFFDAGNLVCEDSIEVFSIESMVPTISQSENSLTSSTAFSYQWYSNGSLITGENSQTLNNVNSGTYSVLVVDENGCSVFSNDYVVMASKSWNCVEEACIELSDDSGLYSSLDECESSCQSSVELTNWNKQPKKLLKIINLLGQEIQFRKGLPMYYLYEDGSVEKKIIID